MSLLHSEMQRLSGGMGPSPVSPLVISLRRSGGRPFLQLSTDGRSLRSVSLASYGAREAAALIDRTARTVARMRAIRPAVDWRTWSSSAPVHTTLRGMIDLEPARS